VVASPAMPSLLHEGLLQLVRDRPDFAAELVRDVLHVPVPEFTSARIAEAALNELVPTEYSSDLVVLLEQERPVFGIVHEAQLAQKERKRFTWPMYGTSLRARLECPVVVVVIAVDDGTARWASEPIPLGGQSVYVPLVIGPQGVPVVTDLELAVRDPELAVLSVMAHGRDDESVAVAVARAATKGIEGFDRERWMLYSALIESSLSDAARKAFEMLPGGQQFRSESQRRSFNEGKATAILDVLEARGLSVTQEQRERILACTDRDQLDRWVRKAVVIASTDELFAD
jgi:hypothetical protein